MTRVYIGAGSNIEREKNLRAGIAALEREVGPLVLSPVYESRAVGFEGENFYNLVIGAETEVEPGDLERLLHRIESRQGRKRSEGKFTSRTLDLDLLLYGDRIISEGTLQIPREDIQIYAFVLRPLAEIAGKARHPLTGERFSEMWERFEPGDQELWPVNVHLEPERNDS